MTMSAIDELRQLCISLAQGAGEVALSGRIADTNGAIGQPPAATKSSATDLVTRHDQAAERYIRERLAAERPGDGLLGEEGSSIESATGVRWIVDPIDGTTNFVYGIPAWGPSVAVAIDDVVVAGAVHFPATGETFHAGLGAGAALGDLPLSVTTIDDVSVALVATGFGYDPSLRAHQGERVARLLPRVRDIRRSGSAAFDLCSVACGRVDAYYEEHLNEWDLAAGLLIARESGALASSLDGGPPSPSSVLVSAPGIHAALVDCLVVTTR